MDDSGPRRTVETPEGVAVVVEVADLGTRAAALLIDLLIVVCAAVLVALLCVWASQPVVGSSLSAALFHLCSFLLRGPYFLFFELRWQGQTPGKRWLGLRVVDRRGGALSPRGLVARNLMREVEVFMPMGLLLTLQFGGDEPWLYYSALLWMGVFTLMPLFNRDRLRVGDMLGGTWVVAAGGRTLGRDLASRWGASGASAAAAATEAPSPAAVFRFNAGQLDVYGIAELQVLEKLLRGPRTPTTRGNHGGGGASGSAPKSVGRRRYPALTWSAFSRTTTRPCVDIWSCAPCSATVGRTNSPCARGPRRAPRPARAKRRPAAASATPGAADRRRA